MRWRLLVALAAAAPAAAGAAALPREWWKRLLRQEDEVQWTVHVRGEGKTGEDGGDNSGEVGDGFPCRFDHYRCKPEALVEMGWSSCCGDPACPEKCDPTGELRPGTQLLLIGNSHMGEIHQAILCQNVHHLTTVTWTPNLDAEANARIMLGLPPPPTVTWTYDAARDELRNTKGGAVKGSPPDSVVAYTFANGARLFTVTNTPMELHAGLGADPRESPFSLQRLGEHLGLDWSQLTHVLFNEGNFRFWAWRLWCKSVQKVLAEEAAQRHRPPNIACPGLFDKKRDLGTVINLPHFLTRLGAVGFRGRALLVRQLMQDTQGAAPPPPIDVSTAPTSGQFGVKFFDWTYALNTRMCACPDCRSAIDHMCMPGPPLDLSRMAVHYFYSDDW